MKIGINARFLAKPYTGIGQYTYGLLRALKKIDKKNQYVLAVPEKVNREISKEISSKRMEIYVVPEPRFGTAGMRKTLWEQWALPIFFNKEKVDLVHQLYVVPSWSKNKKIPEIISVHDTIPYDRPNYRERFLSSLYHKKNLQSLPSADAIITVSKSAKRDILEWISYDPERIYVTYNAPSENISKRAKEVENPFAGKWEQEFSLRGVTEARGVRASRVKDNGPNSKTLKNLEQTEWAVCRALKRKFLFPDFRAPKQDTPPSLLKKYDLKPGRFFLYCGGYDERKNVERLIQAYVKYVARDFPIDLVLAGAPPAKSVDNNLYQSYQFASLTAKFLQASVALPHRGRIVLTGFLSEEELLKLYRSCRAFVSLPVQEGFNIPLIEAATLHSPVLVSDIPVHREIAGSFAVFVDPLNVYDIGQRLRKLAKDDLYAQDLREKMKSVSLPYSWEKAAKKTLKIYASAVERHHSA